MTATNPIYGKKRRVLIVSLVCAIVIIAGGAFLLRSQPPRHAQTPPSKTAPSPSPDEKNDVPLPPKAVDPVVIEAWAVEFTPSPILGEVVVEPLLKEGVEAVGFTTMALQSVDANCDASSGALGMLERTTTPQQLPGGTPRAALAAFGGYYYYFTGPQASCLLNNTDSPANIDLLERQSQLLQDAVHTLKTRE